MKKSWEDIAKFLKIALVVLCLACSLSACKSREECLQDVANEMTTDDAKEKEEQRECFQDKVMGTLYKAMGQAALGSYGNLTKGALSISMLGFAIWFAFRMMQHVSALQAETTGQVWTDISKQFAVCMFCGMLASSTGMLIWTLNVLVFPVFYTFLELSSNVLSLAGESGRDSQCVAGELLKYESVSCTVGQMDYLSSSAKEFPQGPIQMMQCMICGINSRVNIGINLFTYLKCFSFLVACLVAGMFIILKVAYVFYMVDATFRMTMMMVLLPLLILSYPFKKTRGWAKSGFLMIINVSALMMFMGIILAMVLFAFEQIILDNGNLYIEGIEDTSVDVDVLSLCTALLLIAFLAMASTSIAKNLADKMVGGGASDKFASQGGKIIMWVAKRAFASLSGAASKFAKKFIYSTSPALAAKLERIKQLRAKLDKLSGRGMEDD